MAEGRASPQYVWYVIVLLAVINVFNYMDRMALSVLAPSIKADLHFSDAQLGLLIGFAFSLFYAICGVPLARWADRGSRRNLIALAVATWSVMTALCGAAQNFWHLLLVRIGVGAGEAGCVPAAQSMICDYVPLERRAGAFAVHNFGLIAGMMCGMALSGWFVGIVGWRWTFAILGLPGLVLAVIVWLTLREPPRGFFDAAKEDGAGLSLRAAIALLWRNRTYKLLVMMIVVNGFVQQGIHLWLPSFYTRVFGLSLSSVGIHLGLTIGAGSGIGLLIGGVLANKVAHRNVKLPLRIGAASTSMALPAALGILFVPSASVSMLLVGLTGLLCSVAYGPVTATMTSVVAPGVRATALAISTFLLSILGFGLGPLCIGVLSDLLAPSQGTQALRYALIAPVCLIPVMVTALYLASKSLADDLRTRNPLLPGSGITQ